MFSIADIALFPHVASARAMEVEFSPQDHPNLGRWFKKMRALPTQSVLGITPASSPS
jgi:glutathione S-transferase